MLTHGIVHVPFRALRQLRQRHRAVKGAGGIAALDRRSSAVNRQPVGLRPQRRIVPHDDRRIVGDERRCPMPSGLQRSSIPAPPDRSRATVTGTGMPRAPHGTTRNVGRGTRWSDAAAIAKSGVNAVTAWPLRPLASPHRGGRASAYTSSSRPSPTRSRRRPLGWRCRAWRRPRRRPRRRRSDSAAPS